ncbi:MAG TPA: NADH:flavin oxidoreductase/NADH oxidase family protein [Solirubrobacteraceae bacterium]|jgi:2,4-dienoyl-CoA reductase-like NADH-dependent reductase (Old Yellow Enzyme family)|nr:NADH:flavin oxidoreductase/NADH oxidase family protein [Solirubrobacteraceae bacterium]
MSSELFSPLMLRSGGQLRNRIAKAAMEEGMAGDAQLPDERLISLYRCWGDGGAGLLITGNVMVHAEALTGPGGIVLDDRAPLDPFARWAEAGKACGAAMWMQVSHPGRQVQARMPGVVWAPSPVAIELGKHSKRFGQPVAMTGEQIRATVERFATTASLAERVGFDGVEVHAAHGYLLSQFLSPLVNRRSDGWGGGLENRARLLLDVVRAIREVVSSSFAVAVKLNSADFQRGGFDAEDAARVIAMLEPLGVDVVELSGGSYESPAMSGRPADGRAAAREAYFLELAAQLAETSPLPLMLTGGITRRETAEQVLASGIALIGVASAMAITPDLCTRWQEGLEATERLAPVTWSDKTLASAAAMALARHQMRRITRGRRPTGRTHPLHALVCDQRAQRRALGRYRAWLEGGDRTASADGRSALASSKGLSAGSG